MSGRIAKKQTGGCRSGTGLASPPPSDGFLPSSPPTITMPSHHSPATATRPPLSSSPPAMPPPSSPSKGPASCSAKRSRTEEHATTRKRRAVLTPRKFTRFFTPRSQQATALPPLARPALQESSDSFLNEQPSSPRSSHFPSGPSDLPSSPIVESRERRRARASLTSDSTRAQCAHPTKSPSISPAEAIPSGYRPMGVFKLRNMGTNAQLLMREQGILTRPWGSVPLPELDPYFQTSKFFSRKVDRVHSTSLADPSGGNSSLPFSLASCHVNPVSVIGDEDGYVRLFNTQATPAFDMSPEKISKTGRFHQTAIVDLDVSSNDRFFATACGDRTSKVVDMTTMTTVANLSGGHLQSLRSVQFQPGQPNILSTSDRDGTIRVWDIRCKGNAESLSTWGRARLDGQPAERDGPPAMMVNSIEDAHTRVRNGQARPCSVTAHKYLTADRRHLLLSASENDAHMKLWDTRWISTRYRELPKPISITDRPPSHGWRNYGITSMALSTDSARLYAVCRDESVYAYSTSHLILGEGDELSHHNPPRQRNGREKAGLGPIYCFKHAKLEVQSFFVGCSIRSIDNTYHTGPELLAVGSSTGNPILFPTEEHSPREKWERGTMLRWAPKRPLSNPGSPPSTPPFPMEEDLRRERREPPSLWEPGNNSDVNGAGEQADHARCPTVRNGVPLVGGHEEGREVTRVDWSHDGKLVSICDDYSARHWQEHPTEGCQPLDGVPRHARDLRRDSGKTGKRHLAGWAEPPASWDGDASDDEHAEE